MQTEKTLSKELITVIVPAYNVEEWFCRCVDSILNQTYKNLEIILIDDGSTDKTGELVDRYAKKDSRVVPVHQNNEGLVQVRELGIKMANGQYVGFVDGDDEIEADMYEKLFRNMKDYGADISQCGILYCFYDGRRKPMHGTGNLHLYNKNEGFRELMSGVRMEPSLCNKLYKTELLHNSCPDLSIINNEDLLRNSVIFTRAEKSVFEDFCGYHYWRRKESMSNNAKAVQIGQNILNARKLIMDNSDPDLFKYACSSYHSALISVYSSLIKNNQREAKDLKDECRAKLRSLNENNYVPDNKMMLKTKAIVYLPFIYDLLYRMHRKIIYAKIHWQSAKCRKNRRDSN